MATTERLWFCTLTPAEPIVVFKPVEVDEIGVFLDCFSGVTISNLRVQIDPSTGTDYSGNILTTVVRAGAAELTARQVRGTINTIHTRVNMVCGHEEFRVPIGGGVSGQLLPLQLNEMPFQVQFTLRNPSKLFIADIILKYEVTVAGKSMGLDALALQLPWQAEGSAIKRNLPDEPASTSTS